MAFPPKTIRDFRRKGWYSRGPHALVPSGCLSRALREETHRLPWGPMEPWVVLSGPCHLFVDVPHLRMDLAEHLLTTLHSLITMWV